MGQVYIVGSGLGHPDYLTVRAWRLFQQAEVVIYDALGSQALLDLFPESCLRVFVGKRGGKKSTPQRTINQLLVAHAQTGKQVIRLKGGDPYIFGRSHPEILALTEAGCDFEVVPGLSSALAAPLLAGIPLTHKTLSRGFFIGTAHDLEAFDWSALAQLDTLVFLMGGRQLENLCQRLIAQGRSPELPVAVIRAGGLENQELWEGTLQTITKQTDLVKKLSPCVIIVGQVIRLRQDYMHPAPLNGKTILVTRAATQSSEFTELLIKTGARILEMPALEIRAPSTWDPLDQAIASLKDIHWLILTSANAVNYFFERLHHLGLDARALGQLKIAVVGKKTDKFLRTHGLRADYIPPDFVADALVDHFPEPLAQKTILFPRVETGGRTLLTSALTEQGATVLQVPVYESGCPSAITPAVWQAIQDQAIDVVTFASSKTVRNFWQLIQDAGGNLALLDTMAIASIGPQTSLTCRELLQRVDCEATVYNLEGIRDAILELFVSEA